MEGPDSPPYDEVEELCKLLKVRFSVYDLPGTLKRCIDVVAKLVR